jgi:acetoin utilization protein AcuB
MELWKGERRPTIKLVMTPFPHSVDIDDPVTRAEEIMREHDVRHVPVEEGGKLVGVATHRDTVRLVNPALDEHSRQRIRVRQVYTPNPYVVDLNAPLDRVLLEMAERHIGSALVVRKDKLVGIFTVTDACRVLARLVRLQFNPSGGDNAA